jgi:uncharacterized protein
LSYVELKHLFADLALDAVKHPERAAWAAVAAAYAQLADRDHPSVPAERVLARSAELAQHFGRRPDSADLEFLVEHGLLERRGGVVAARPAFVPHLAYLARQARRLLEALRMARGPTRETPDLERGIALFNAGLFFECHELLEEVWRATNGPAKDFYHGIVQVAASFYHYEKRNQHGAQTLLRKGLQRLAAYPDEYQSVRLGEFRANLHRWMERFASREPADPGEYPKLSVVA